MAEAKGPTWAEAQALEKRLSVIKGKIRDLYLLTKDEAFFSDTNSEAEREAKLAKIKEERLFWIREHLRLCSEIREPDFSGMTEADRAAEAERLRQEALQEARRLTMAGDAMAGLAKEGYARILDFDPKQGGGGGRYCNRTYFVDLATFDHDEESPQGPMKFTDAVYGNNTVVDLCAGINVLSVKITSSDVGFPIQVYGTVTARDSIDYRCVYLFRRDRDHCQLISSKDQPLILTGPKRGLALLDDNFVETDLKIKDHQGQDRELSKGVLTIRRVARLGECEVHRDSLATRLSTVDVMFALVKRAVEATIAIEVVRGKFYGTITAHTTSIQERLVPYDSKMAGAMTGVGVGVIQLMRPVVSVYVKDMLTIVAKTGDGKSVSIKFTPRVNNRDEIIIRVGATKMRVMVAWSIMDP